NWPETLHLGPVLPRVFSIKRRLQHAQPRSNYRRPGIPRPRPRIGPMTAPLRLPEPAPGIVAFYDGRIEGYRFDPKPNWVDDGALGLGVASYAIVDGDAGLVYDP